MADRDQPPAAVPPLLRPQANIMLSRVAHSLYWMARYIERAENVARLLEVNLQFLYDVPGLDEAQHDQHWESLVLSSGDEELFSELHGRANPRTVTEFFAFDLRNANSILASVYAARENARMIRDQISIEMWETINELHLFLKAHSTAGLWADGPNEFFAQVKRASHLFQGLTASTYSRSEGWEFIEFGQYLERADQTTRILDVKYHILLPSASHVGGALDTAQWQALLRSASALEAYRRYYVREILPWKAAEFLVFSDSFPRSLHFCVARLDDLLHRILDEAAARPRSRGGRACRRLLADLQSLTITDVVEGGLHEFLMGVQKTLSEIGDDLVRTTMFYPAESSPEEQQQQQQQQQRAAGRRAAPERLARGRESPEA